MCAAMLEPKPSDPNGVSPLHLAAKNGHIDVIRYENPSVLPVCLSHRLSVVKPTLPLTHLMLLVSFKNYSSAYSCMYEDGF